MAKTLSKTGISTDSTIKAAHVTQSVDALTGTYAYNITVSGSLTVTGSTNITGAFSATTLSGDGSGITGITGEWDGSHNGDASITGSLKVSGSTGALTIKGASTSTLLDIDSNTVSNIIHVLGTGKSLFNSLVEITGSLSQGWQNIASGDYSHAEGSGSIAYGKASHAGGLFTIASGSGQVTVGTYNERGNTTSLFVVGDGGADGARHDLARFNSQSIYFGNHITASGNISASGDIKGTSLTTDQKIIHNGDTDTFINFIDDEIRFEAGGLLLFSTHKDGGGPHEVTVNEGGNNVDFIIEDDANNDYFIADASTSRIGIGKGNTTPSATLHVSGAGATNVLIDCDITASGNISASGDVIARSGSFDVISRVGDPDTRIYFSDDDINITVGGINMVDFTEDTNDEITFNEGAADLDVRIEGEDEPNLLFTDASTPGKVGIGTNTPSHKLTVEGSISASGDLYVSGDTQLTGSLLLSGSQTITEGALNINTDGGTVDNNLHIYGINAQILELSSSNASATINFRVADGANAVIDINEGENNRWKFGLDSDDNQFKFANGGSFTNNSTLSLDHTTGKMSQSGSVAISGSITYEGIATKTTTGSPHTLGEADHLIIIDGSGGAVTINLPLAASYPGRQINFKLSTNPGGNTITLQRQGSDTIDGANTNTSLDAQYEALSVISDGSAAWYIF